MKTMHYLKTILAIVPAIALCTGFAACSNDDDDNDADKNPDVPERETVTTFDDLAYFQDAFIETDSLGKFIAHCVGTPIYENDPTHLYIGVETIQEALEYWDACLAPDITRTTSVANSYNYTLTDKDGQSQGTVSFAPGTESGHVAEITTNATDLKHFKTVTFLLNSAWPFNSGESKWHIGDMRPENTCYYDDDDHQCGYVGTYNFVCVREKSNGVKPLFVAITYEQIDANNLHASELLSSKYCPGEAKAKQISELLRKDWELFEACFEEAYCPLKKGWYYWYDKKVWKWVYLAQGCICLSTGELSEWDCLFHNPTKHVLLKVDWLDD